MIEKLTFVKRDSTDREGNPLISKQGKPYTRMSIKVESRGDRYLSGFANAGNASWKPGDEVDIVITEAQAKDKNGQPYLNFSQPKPADIASEGISKILDKLTAMQLDINTIKSHVIPKKKATYGDPELDASPETAFDIDTPDDPFAGTPF